jgi:hypothetical protein
MGFDACEGVGCSRSTREGGAFIPAPSRGRNSLPGLPALKVSSWCCEAVGSGMGFTSAPPYEMPCILVSSNFPASEEAGLHFFWGSCSNAISRHNMYKHVVLGVFFQIGAENRHVVGARRMNGAARFPSYFLGVASCCPVSTHETFQLGDRFQWVA